MKNTLRLLQPIANKSTFYQTSYKSLMANPNRTFAYFGDREVTLQSIKEDPHVSATIQARLAGIQSLEYEIVFDESNQKYSSIFEHVFNKLDIKQFIDKVMEAVFFGFQVMEINWQYEYIDGQLYLLPFSITEKPRSWFVFDNNNVLRLNDQSKIELPGYKFLLLQNKPTYDNPYGEALLSKCLWPVVFKKSGFTFWLLLAEKLGMPHLIGKTDATFGTEEFEAFMENLDNLIQDGSMVIPVTDNVESLNPVNSANVDIYEKLINICNLEISKALLSQTLTTEIGDTGSRAAAETHKSIKDEVANSDKLIIEEAIYKIFKWVAYFNFEGIKPPYVSFFQKEDVAKPLAEFVDILTKNNQIKFTKKFYINRFNFEEDEFELIDSPNPQPAFADEQKEFVKSDTTPWDQILIDSIGDKLVNDNSGIFKDSIEKIKKFINSHNSYEDAINQISDLFGDLNSDQLEETLTRILFIADTIGRLSVQEELKDARTD